MGFLERNSRLVTPPLVRHGLAVNSLHSGVAHHTVHIHEIYIADISELMKKALQAPKGRARRSPPPLAAAGDGDPQQDTSTQKQQLQTDTPSPHNKDIPSSDTMLQTSSFTPTIDAKSKRQEEVPLAAKTLMKAHNRRKSVFQRPSRYGEWFDGDDDELERMVEEEECDEINDALPHKAAQDDVANKVHAIANSLCEKLDGLIEESPAVKAAPTDSKSLRDKLLESWEGRVWHSLQALLLLLLLSLHLIITPHQYLLKQIEPKQE